MSVSDPIADMLTKIRNACVAKHERVDVMPSNMKMEILKILQEEGFIANFKKINENERNFIRILLKYDMAENPVIHGLRSVSTPGRRVYSGYKKMPRIMNGFGTVIVSTSSGMLTGRAATNTKVGGEIICAVW